MTTKPGLVPCPLESVCVQSSESLTIEFESSESSDGLTPEDHKIVANAILPFCLNRLLDLSEYPLIATLINDKLTNNLKMVNDDSLEEDVDTLNDRFAKECHIRVVKQEESQTQAAGEGLTRVNPGTVEE